LMLLIRDLRSGYQFGSFVKRLFYFVITGACLTIDKFSATNDSDEGNSGAGERLWRKKRICEVFSECSTTGKFLPLNVVFPAEDANNLQYETVPG